MSSSSVAVCAVVAGMRASRVSGGSVRLFIWTAGGAARDWRCLASEGRLSDSLDANGTAIVTSSAAGEASQESSELRGSFFTHALLAGLRGAADRDGDERVTLTEVYEYAYGRTVAQTAATVTVQHPTYDFELSGRGRVVLAELGRGGAKLQIGPGASGVFVITREPDGQLVAEMSKPDGVVRELALPPGQYKVVQAQAGRAATITLARGATSRLDPLRLPRVGALALLAKHDEGPSSLVQPTAYYALMSGAFNSYGVVHQGGVGLRVRVGPLAIEPHASFGSAALEDGEHDVSYRLAVYSLESCRARQIPWSER